MPSYRPKSVVINASTIQNGVVEKVSEVSLSNWNWSLVKGRVENIMGSAMTNVAIKIIMGTRVVGSTFVPLGYFNTIFTDINGEYGVSLPLITEPLAFIFDFFTPID